MVRHGPGDRHPAGVPQRLGRVHDVVRRGARSHRGPRQPAPWPATSTTSRTTARSRPCGVGSRPCAPSTSTMASRHRPTPRRSASPSPAPSGANADRAKTATPVSVAELRAMSRALPATLAGLRDRAVLLLGYGAGLRPGELVRLDVAHVRRVPAGLRVDVGRRPVVVPFGSAAELCAVDAWTRWRHGASLRSGPAFRAVDRHEHVGTARLSVKAITRIVRRAADRAGARPGPLPRLVAAARHGGRRDRARRQRRRDHGSHAASQSPARAPLHGGDGPGRPYSAGRSMIVAGPASPTGASGCTSIVSRRTPGGVVTAVTTARAAADGSRYPPWRCSPKRGQ